MFSAVLSFVLASAASGTPGTDTTRVADSPRPRVEQSRVDSAAPRADSIQVGFAAFIDGYVAWDGGRPRSIDRRFSTQPARHNEFNINLALVEASLKGERIRGRVALQAGTSVQSNYAGEPQVGAVSGGTLSRHLQEAVVGVAVTPTLWIDGGVYASYIGLEGWISRDNATYSRSLIADYTPYYLSGVKATWQVTPQLSAQLHLVNGWQNISETNSDKALGARLDWQAHRDWLLVWDVFVGNEQPDSLPDRLRVLNQVAIKHTRGPWELSAVLDGGRQSRGSAGSDWWTGSSVIVRRLVGERTALVLRGEHLYDRGQVLVVTGTPDGFRTTGASVGVDFRPDARLLWRSELRGYRSGDAIWPRAGGVDGNRRSWMAVTSLALTL